MHRKYPERSRSFNTRRWRLRHQIYRSLSAEVKDMWDSGQVRVEIRGFASGSVVANLTIISTLNHSSDLFNASTAISLSLMNSSKYSLDPSSTHLTGTCFCSFKGAFSIVRLKKTSPRKSWIVVVFYSQSLLYWAESFPVLDFNECASGDNDCSPWATCTNTWASYTCACLKGFRDHHPERPGRACQGGGEKMTPHSFLAQRLGTTEAHTVFNSWRGNLYTTNVLHPWSWVGPLEVHRSDWSYHSSIRKLSGFARLQGCFHHDLWPSSAVHHRCPNKHQSCHRLHLLHPFHRSKHRPRRPRGGHLGPVQGGSHHCVGCQGFPPERLDRRGLSPPGPAGMWCKWRQLHSRPADCGLDRVRHQARSCEFKPS